MTAPDTSANDYHMMWKSAAERAKNAERDLTRAEARLAEAEKDRDDNRREYLRVWQERDAQRRRAEAAEARLVEAEKARDDYQRLCEAKANMKRDLGRAEARADVAEAALAKAREALTDVYSRRKTLDVNDYAMWEKVKEALAAMEIK